MVRTGKFPRKIYKFFFGYYNILLTLLLLLFILRPYDRSYIYLAIWKLLLGGALVSAVFNCNHSRVIKWIASLLALPAILLSWINLDHHNEVIFVGNAIFTVLLMTLCAGSVVRDVLVRARVTVETLRGVICAYFMVAFLFAYIYYLISFFSPDSFQLTGKEISPHFYTHYLSEMLYFSFITLLTIGYGDIIAIQDFGQTAVVIEGIIGQFYIAILVARLVSVYSLHSNQRILRGLEELSSEEIERAIHTAPKKSKPS